MGELGLDATLTLCALLAATVFMALDRLGPDLVMFSTLSVLVILGVVTPSDALRGFGNPAVATIGVLFVSAAAVQDTGALHRVSELIFGQTRRPRVALARLVVPTTILSGFMNNAPIVAMFIPMVRDFCQRLGVNPSRFLIPLSYAAMLGGTLTLIGTSANLVVAGLYTTHGYAPLGMLEITRVGLPISAAALAYLIFVGPLLLRDRSQPLDVAHEEAREFLAEVEVAADSPLIGRTVEAAGLRHLPGLFLVEIRATTGRVIRPVAPENRLRAGDHLVFIGVASTVEDLARYPGLVPVDGPEVPRGWKPFEVVVSPRSPLVGPTIRDSGFRRRYNAAILAVHRSGERVEGRIGDIHLRSGDTLMLLSSPGFRKAWRNSSAFTLVSESSEAGPPNYRKASLALATLGGMVLLPTLTTMPLLVSGMAAVLVLIATGCVTPQRARESVAWPVLVLIGSAIGVSTALEQSGAARAISELLLGLTEPLGPRAILTAIWLLGALFASFISNAAAAALVFPIAIVTAQSAGLDPKPVALCLALATSAGFSTPIGSNSNLLVFSPGGYRYRDFTRVGLPLTGICLAGAVLLVPWIWPLVL